MQIRPGPVFDAGAAVSSVFSLGQLKPYFIITPLTWTPANLLFLFSPESTNFYPIYKDGRPLGIGCIPNVAISVPSDMFPNGTYLRFVSGSINGEIPQLQTCEFKIITS